HDFLREIPNAHWTTAELPAILTAAPNAVDRQLAMDKLLQGTPSDTVVQMVADAVRADKGQFPAFRSIARLGELKRPELRPLFREALAHPSPVRRVQAIKALGKLEPDKETILLLRGLVNDHEHYPVISASLAVLRDWDAPANRDVFKKATEMTRPPVFPMDRTVPTVMRFIAYDGLARADAVQGKRQADPEPLLTQLARTCPRIRLKDVKAFEFLAAEDVDAREAARLGGKLRRIAYYKVIGRGTQFLEFYVTAGGTLGESWEYTE